MSKIADFILEKIKEDYCIILGTDEMIDNFSEEFRVDVNIMLMDYRDNDDIKTDMIKLYNARTKEIVTLGMVKKIDIINIINMRIKTKGEKTDLKDIIGIELEKEERKKGIYPIMAKTDKDKKRLVNELLKEPKEEDLKRMRELIKKEKTDEYIGYV